MRCSNALKHERAQATLQHAKPASIVDPCDFDLPLDLPDDHEFALDLEKALAELAPPGSPTVPALDSPRYNNTQDFDFDSIFTDPDLQLPPRTRLGTPHPNGTPIYQPGDTLTDRELDDFLITFAIPPN